MLKLPFGIKYELSQGKIKVLKVPRELMRRKDLLTEVEPIFNRDGWYLSFSYSLNRKVSWIEENGKAYSLLDLEGTFMSVLRSHDYVPLSPEEYSTLCEFLEVTPACRTVGKAVYTSLVKLKLRHEHWISWESISYRLTIFKFRKLPVVHHGQ